MAAMTVRAWKPVALLHCPSTTREMARKQRWNVPPAQVGEKQDDSKERNEMLVAHVSLGMLADRTLSDFLSPFLSVTEKGVDVPNSISPFSSDNFSCV